MKRGTIVMSGIKRVAVTPPGSPPLSSSRPLIDPPRDVMTRQTEPAEGLQSSCFWSLASTLPVIPGRSTTTSREVIERGDFRQGGEASARKNARGRGSAAPKHYGLSAHGEPLATHSLASV